MKILNIKIPGEYYHQCILAGDLRVKTLVLSISQHAALIWFCSWLFGSNIQAVAFWMPIYTLIATMVITVVVKIIGHLHYLHSRLQLELANYFSRSTTTKRVPEIINEDPEDLGDFDKAADLLHPGQVSIVESTVQNLSEFSSMTDSSYLRRPTNEGIVEHSGYLPLN
ncbi:hypothetical protein BGZ60DRAFT_399487 [Tricladium varicosporioides]|nr:hypothetical protein BGZ60DRAFT_399487 [Hymenoscyphus varicosporioides]